VPPLQRGKLPQQSPQPGALGHAYQLNVSKGEFWIRLSQFLWVGQEEKKINIWGLHDCISVEAEEMATTSLIDTVKRMKVDS
jgi:hypothetical protein